MKLLTLVTDAFGGHGGIAKFNRDLLGALSSYPSCDRVVALPRVVRGEVTGVPTMVDFRTRAAGGRIAYGAELARALAITSIDGVVCGHLHLLPLAGTAARLRGVPLLLITHGVEAWEPPRKAFRSWLPRVDALVSVSRLTQERFLAWSQLNPRHTFVVPNCVDESAFGSGPRDPELLRRYGLEGRVVLLTVGRLAATERYKGVDETLELLPLLAADLPNIAYLIVGDGDDLDRLKRKARALGISDRVTFAGHVPESEKAAHYRLADVFVMAGKGEGFGIVYLEALACGIPVVASSLDASREAILGGRLGELANPDDPAALRDAIMRALRRPRGIPEELKSFSVDAFRERWHRVVATCFTAPASRAGEGDRRVVRGPQAKRRVNRHATL